MKAFQCLSKLNKTEMRLCLVHMKKCPMCSFFCQLTGTTLGKVMKAGKLDFQHPGFLFNIQKPLGCFGLQMLFCFQ